MNITHFNDLIAAAHAQAEPQRLLLVFANASLPENPTAEQRAPFDAGEAGELAPLMCVDKGPGELADFDALVKEASVLGADWVLVFAAALSGHAGQPPGASQIDAALQRMVEAVKTGQLSGFVPFDRSGNAVQLG
jgi:hypothetical protein